MQRKGEIKDSLYPSAEDKSLARVDEFLEWDHLGFRLPIGITFHMKYLFPLMGLHNEEAIIKHFGEMLEKNLGIMENIWLKDGPFIAGNQLTAADILGACEIEQSSIL